MCIYVYVYMYICTYVYMYICICIYIYVLKQFCSFISVRSLSCSKLGVQLSTTFAHENRAHGGRPMSGGNGASGKYEDLKHRPRGVSMGFHRKFWNSSSTMWIIGLAPWKMIKNGEINGIYGYIYMVGYIVGSSLMGSCPIKVALCVWRFGPCVAPTPNWPFHWGILMIDGRSHATNQTFGVYTSHIRPYI